MLNENYFAFCGIFFYLKLFMEVGSKLLKQYGHRLGNRGVRTMKKIHYNRRRQALGTGGEASAIVTEIIQKRSVATLFQPIISVKNHAVTGLEALSRGMTLSAPNPVTPDILFKEAARLGMTIELDRLCREQALARFRPIHRNNPELFLFMNFDTSIIDEGVVGSGHLINSVIENGLPPQSIIIEICESRTRDFAALQQFIQLYKEYGFLIAMDDVGVGSSNLDRILLVKPDIIKIDRWLVSHIDQDCYKQEVFNSIVRMSRRIGALVVAEGIETESEAVVSCELGADFLQGYYFAKPLATDALNFAAFNDKINIVSRKLKEYKMQKVESEVSKRRLYQQIAWELAGALTGADVAEFDSHLRKLAWHPIVECVYILDKDGIQVSESICDMSRFPVKSNALFQAAHKGVDQSLKKYYIYIHAGMEQYITQPYISHMSGNLCLTTTTLFTAADKQQYIVCVDFSAAV